METTQSPSVHKIFRTLARLHHDPEWATPGHRSLLKEIDDQSLAKARDLILAGRELVWKALQPDADPALAALLRLILTEHRPKAAAIAKRKALNASLTDLWEEKPIFSDPGIGEWPEKHPHTCRCKGQEGTVITIRDKETTFTPMITPRWRDSEKRPGCRACYQERIKRQARQVLYEIERIGKLVWIELPDDMAYKRFAANTRKKRERSGLDGSYRAYPQADGNYFIVCQTDLAAAGQCVSNDRGELARLLDQWCQTPEDKRISSSNGWGGPWQGNRGDGRVKQAKKEGEQIANAVQLWTGSSVFDVAKALHIDLSPFDKSFAMHESAIDVYEKLTIAGFEMYERKTNRSGLTAFLEFIGANVTDKAQEAKQKDPLFAMRDNPAKEKAKIPVLAAREGPERSWSMAK